MGDAYLISSASHLPHIWESPAQWPSLRLLKHQAISTPGCSSMLAPHYLWGRVQLTLYVSVNVTFLVHRVNGPPWCALSRPSLLIAMTQFIIIHIGLAPLCVSC